MAALDAVTWVLEPGRAPSQRADCTVLADRVGALEDPILPGGRRAKILVSSVSGPAEPQRRFHRRQSVEREALRARSAPRRPDKFRPLDIVRARGYRVTLRHASGECAESGYLGDGASCSGKNLRPLDTPIFLSAPHRSMPPQTGSRETV
jgi:hypothetical protein